MSRYVPICGTTATCQNTYDPRHVEPPQLPKPRTLLAMSSHPTFAQTEQIPAVSPPQDPPPSHGRPKKKWGKGKRITLIVGLVLVMLLGAGSLSGGLYRHSIQSGIDRVDAFNQVPEQSRPTKAVQDAQNILLLGSDSR